MGRGGGATLRPVNSHAWSSFTPGKQAGAALPSSCSSARRTTCPACGGRHVWASPDVRKLPVTCLRTTFIFTDDDTQVLGQWAKLYALRACRDTVPIVRQGSLREAVKDRTSPLRVPHNEGQAQDRKGGRRGCGYTVGVRGQWRRA